MEFKDFLPYAVTIGSDSRGNFTVAVGCINRSYGRTPGELDTLLLELREYFSNPKKVVDEYNKASQTECRPETACEEVAPPTYQPEQSILGGNR